jgi:CubicO group peptidase (beta-lactamase class C family)
MRRREFFGYSAAAALGFSLSPLPGWSQDKPSEKKNDLAAPAPSFDIIIRNLEQQTLNVLDENFVPGLAIVLIRNGKAGWHRAFGVRDSESKKPVDDGTIFEAASMGKPVFAYAVMKLCERGMLNLDTPLTRYTPERYLKGDPRARPHHSASRAFAHKRFPELAVGQRAAGNPLHARRKVHVFR